MAAFNQLKKRIDGSHSIVVLMMAEIFADEFGGTRLMGGGEDHGVPERELPAGLQFQATLERGRVLSTICHWERSSLGIALDIICSVSRSINGPISVPKRDVPNSRQSYSLAPLRILQTPVAKNENMARLRLRNSQCCAESRNLWRHPYAYGSAHYTEAALFQHREILLPHMASKYIAWHHTRGGTHYAH